MKEMTYGIRKKSEVLYSGEYKGHKFAILSLGSHPTAYVENKMDITDCYDCRLYNVGVHGGFTYCGTGHWNEESTKISWLGWDYAHYGDYCYGDTSQDSKQWTTAEIYDEVKSVIDQIVAVEEYNDSPEYKAIRDMILAAENDDRDIQRACKKLYSAGYRKQSDVAENIIAMLKAAKPVVKTHFEAYDELIENIAAEYGVEVEE